MANEMILKLPNGLPAATYDLGTGTVAVAQPIPAGVYKAELTQTGPPPEAGGGPAHPVQPTPAPTRR